MAHSLGEAYLYLMVTPCATCGKGPLAGGDAKRVDTPAGRPLCVAIDAACGACNRSLRLRFELPHGTGVDAGTGLPTINPTDEPSRLIDVAQYLTLFRVITERAARTKDKQESRRLGLEAAQCLQEALKFYEADNDLPPSAALFAEPSRRRLADHPQEFSRQRLLDLRAKLPAMSLIRAGASQAIRPRRRWWKFW
ncbi:MAG: hypothetical protein IT449_11995 [Phycisphaerales bacterium]|nr:hypothetical protein [Phycisphaerales bacterium]